MKKISKQQLINLIKEEISEIQSTPTNRGGYEEAVQMLMNAGLPEKTAVDVLRRLRSGEREVKPHRGDAPMGDEPVTLRKLGDRPLEESSELADLERQMTAEEEKEYEELLARQSDGEKLSTDDLDKLLFYLELTSPRPSLADTVDQPVLQRPGDTYKEFPALERPDSRREYPHHHGRRPPFRDVMGGDLFRGLPRGSKNNTLEEVIRREIKNFLKNKA